MRPKASALMALSQALIVLASLQGVSSPQLSPPQPLGLSYQVESQTSECGLYLTNTLCTIVPSYSFTYFCGQPSWCSFRMQPCKPLQLLVASSLWEFSSFRMLFDSFVPFSSISVVSFEHRNHWSPLTSPFALLLSFWNFHKPNLSSYLEKSFEPLCEIGLEHEKQHGIELTNPQAHAHQLGSGTQRT
ncbi:hypothetical protein VNO77_19025 [Canavalia gladiata]|uniref:Uncharacterized protein n=1 Tax=Canavalia gladiata TaxID=3824 RepID=A0AAN9QK56_CANGL